MQMQMTPGTALAPLRPATVARGGWMQRSQAIMGTTVTVQLWADDRARGIAAMAAVMAETQRVERAFSSQRSDSELSLVNAAAPANAVRLSDELYRLVVRAIEFSRLSQGVFDITCAGAGRLYDYRAGIAPDDAALARALPAVSWQHLRLEPVSRTLHYTHPGTRIDLGGFAKGHALDSSSALLARQGVRHAIVSAGGDSRVIGDRRGRPWTVAIRDPRDASRVVAMLPLEDTAISTSADCGRYFERDGVRHHPVLDPRSGRSPQQLRSVTVLAEDGLTAEALSKTVFVLGVEAGLALVQAMPGVDAVVIDAAGGLHCTAGFEQLQRGA